MSDKADITEVGAVPTNGSSYTGRRTFGQKLVGHFRKYWWVHLIVTIVVVLVVTLPLVYVGYPRIAQDDVNKSTLNVTSMVITNPTPNSFHLNQTQVLGVHGTPFKPTIFSFSSVVALLGFPVFANVQVPQTVAQNGQVVHVVQEVQLTDVKAFTDYTKAVMLQEQVDLTIAGRPQLKLGALPTETINYNKTITMTALNKLKGFNVTEFQILLTPLPDGTNLNGTTYLPNPSVMTITMGNLTLDLSVDGTPIGQSFMNDVVLKPGDNYFPMTSKTDQVAVLGFISGKNAKYTNGIVPVTIKGNSSVYNGQELPYFSAALAANTLTIPLNIGAALGLHLGGGSSGGK